MRTTVAFLGTLGTILTGCSPEGVYLVRMSLPEDAVCTTEVKSHNYLDAVEPDVDAPANGPWTFTEDATFSEQLFFFEIIDSAKGESVLIVGENAYPGLRNGGLYEFRWDQFSDGTIRDEHESGYIFEQSGLESYESVILIDLKGKSALGTITTDAIANQAWSETDEWDSFAIGVATGQTPSAGYLFDQDSFSISNEAAADDCSSETCLLEVESHCTQSMSFTASRVDLDHEAYENVATTGQEGGWVD